MPSSVRSFASTIAFDFTLLQEEASAHPAQVIGRRVAWRHLEDADVAPAAELLQRLLGEAGRQDDVVAHALAAARALARAHRLRQRAVDRPVAGDDAAEGRDRVA